MHRLSTLQKSFFPTRSRGTFRQKPKRWMSTENDDNQVYIVSATRTPIGSIYGSLAEFPATKLAAIAMRSAVEKANISSELIEEVQLGLVIQGMIGQNPAHIATTEAGLSKSMVSTVLNRMCGSGFKAYTSIAQSLRLGYIDVAIAGGVESLSNAPFYLPRSPKPYRGTQLVDGIVLELTDPKYQILQGCIAENAAKKLSIGREEQDDWTLESYRRTKKALDKIIEIEITPVEIAAKPKEKKPSRLLTYDEELDRDVSKDKLSKLEPVFTLEDGTGTITAGNTAGLGDGASAAVLASGRAIKQHGLKPLARIVEYIDIITDSMDYVISSTYALKKVLRKTGMNISEIDMFEINETFSVVPLANIKLLNLDPAKVNVNGGSLCMGYPFAMVGSRLINHLALHMEPGQFGLVALPYGGGGASAMILEKL